MGTRLMEIGKKYQLWTKGSYEYDNLTSTKIKKSLTFGPQEITLIYGCFPWGGGLNSPLVSNRVKIKMMICQKLVVASLMCMYEENISNQIKML